MPETPLLTTQRLVLRRWLHKDHEPFAAMNADPEVMEYFPAALTPGQSDELIDRIENGFEEHGFGLWAVEIAETGRFIGFTGLAVNRFEAHFTPAVEVGWRLARSAWGHGYASEAARRAITAAFEDFALVDIVSMTARTNVRSQRVMWRIAMTRDPADDFDHPLERHVLYRLTAEHWRAQPRG